VVEVRQETRCKVSLSVEQNNMVVRVADGDSVVVVRSGAEVGLWWDELTPAQVQALERLAAATSEALAALSAGEAGH